jgi:hypothetical protein
VLTFRFIRIFLVKYVPSKLKLDTFYLALKHFAPTKYDLLRIPYITKRVWECVVSSWEDCVKSFVAFEKLSRSLPQWNLCFLLPWKNGFGKQNLADHDHKQYKQWLHYILINGAVTEQNSMSKRKRSLSAIYMEGHFDREHALAVLHSSAQVEWRIFLLFFSSNSMLIYAV